MGRVKRSRCREAYFEYLCDIVNVNFSDRSFFLLAKDLDSKNFIWSVPNDDNREVDAMDIRRDFYGRSTPESPLSVFEVLIGIAIRFEESLSSPEEGDLTGVRFWEMMNNLDLDRYDDENYMEYYGSVEIENTINKFLRRMYDKNGRGGLFPLENSKEDQRKVEIWYQMNAYLLEKY